MSITGFTDIGKGRKVLSINHDPTSVGTDAPMGSLLIDANGKVYRKTDDGETTNVICVAMCKCNYDATVAPTVNNDSGGGYSVGSYWYDVTADKAYVCLDAAAAVAVWKKITSIGESYADRGDPSAVDFTVGNFTPDGTWRELDLSSIVSAGGASKPVHIALEYKDNVLGSLFSLRTKGNNNPVNAFRVVVIVVALSTWAEGWVTVDAARKIEYTIPVGVSWGILNLTVRGWMEDA